MLDSEFGLASRIAKNMLLIDRDGTHKEVTQKIVWVFEILPVPCSFGYKFKPETS